MPSSLSRTRAVTARVLNRIEKCLALTLMNCVQKQPALEVWSLRCGGLHPRGEAAEDFVEGRGHTVVATLLALGH